jgi:hypothetical protein
VPANAAITRASSRTACRLHDAITKAISRYHSGVPSFSELPAHGDVSIAAVIAFGDISTFWMAALVTLLWQCSASIGPKTTPVAKKIARQLIDGEWWNSFFAQDARKPRLSLLCMCRKKPVQCGAVATPNRINDTHMLADVDLHLRFEDILLGALDFVNQDQQASEMTVG